MSYIDYRVVATARNDDVADKFALWLREQLNQLNPRNADRPASSRKPAPAPETIGDPMPSEWGKRLYGRRRGVAFFSRQPIAPVVERLEPAPQTNTPRVMVRFIFDSDADLEFYNSTAAPYIRKELATMLKRWKEEALRPVGVPAPPAPKPPSDSGTWTLPKPNTDAPLPVTPPAAAPAAPIKPEVKGGAAPAAVIPEPPALPTSTPTEQDPITLARNKLIMSRLPPLAWVIPIVVGCFIVFAMFYGTNAVQPTLNQPWPETARQVETPVDPAAARAQADAEKKAAGGASGSTDTPKKAPEAVVRFVNEQKYAASWLASYVGFVGVLAMVTCVSFTQVRRGVDQVNLSAPLWGGSRETDRPWRHKYPMTFANAVLVGLAVVMCVVAIVLAIRAPNRLAMLKESLGDAALFNQCRLDTIQRCNVRSVLFVTTALALAFASLLMRQRRRDAQPLPTTIHIRLKAARSLLNAGSAALVCGVLHMGFLVQMTLPARAGEQGSAFAWNYSIAWGVMFTILLAGFYVPTVSALTSWGHRYVLLNSADDTQEVRVAKLDRYDTAFRAEFKPYLSLAAALAPAGAAVVAKLIESFTQPGA